MPKHRLLASCSIQPAAPLNTKLMQARAKGRRAKGTDRIDELEIVRRFRPAREESGIATTRRSPMSRNARCVLPGLPYHVTQRGTNRQKVFFSTAHRKIYLSLVAKNLEDAGVRVLAYCLMTNHVHWVVVPERDDSLAILFRRVHGAYAQAVNAGLGRSGHLWQNRFFSCPLSEQHMWIALRMWKRIRCGRAWQKSVGDRWSSAGSHLSGVPDRERVLDCAGNAGQRPLPPILFSYRGLH